MNKKVVALSGRHNVGKSSTIKEFVELVKKHFGTAAVIEEQDHHNPNADIQLVITINGSIKVGVESQGDPGGRLEASLKLLVELNCDIIFCATRTRGHTCWLVSDLQPLEYRVEWVAKTPEPDEDQQDDTNRQVAGVLLNKLIAFVEVKA